MAEWWQNFRKEKRLTLAVSRFFMVRDKGLEPKKMGIMGYYVVLCSSVKSLEFQRLKAVRLDFTELHEMQFFEKCGRTVAEFLSSYRCLSSVMA